MTTLTAWVRDNPVLFSVVVWPIVSGAVLGLFKPRTPEEYAQMNPYLAGFLMFVSATGFDPNKMLQGLEKMLTGRSLPISTAQARDLLQAATVVRSSVPNEHSPVPNEHSPVPSDRRLGEAQARHSGSLSEDQARRLGGVADTPGVDVTPSSPPSPPSFPPTST